MNEESAAEAMAHKEYMADLFGRAARTYDQVGPRFFAHFGRRLVELAGIVEGSRVLDVATGRGAVLFPAATAAGATGKVVGIDYSEAMVAATAADIAQSGFDNIEVILMDAEELDFPDDTFDCVLCGLSIFAFPRPEVALAEMRRVLAPAGRIGLTTFWRDDERWSWLGELFQKYLPAPDRAPEEETEEAEEAGSEPDFRTQEGMHAFLASAGFREISIRGEEPDFVYASEEEWWATVWSHGMRGTLERIERTSGSEALQAFKRDAFERLQEVKGPAGFHHMWSVLYTLAAK